MNEKLTTSDIVWIIGSLAMFTLMVIAPKIFMVLLLPWMFWGFCKEANEHDPRDYRE